MEIFCYRESVALFFGVLWLLDSRYICSEVENSWALISGHTHWASNSKIAGSNPSVVIWCSVLCTCIDKALLYEIYIVSIHSVETGCQVMLRVNLWETGVPSRGSRWSALVSYGDEHRPSWLREGFNIYMVKPKIPLLLLLILFVGLTEMLYWSGLYSTWC